jgi:hypothetical protein
MFLTGETYRERAEPRAVAHKEPSNPMVWGCSKAAKRDVSLDELVAQLFQRAIDATLDGRERFVRQLCYLGERQIGAVA